jgi:hypothetical protein
VVLEDDAATAEAGHGGTSLALAAEWADARRRTRGLVEALSRARVDVVGIDSGHGEHGGLPSEERACGSERARSASAVAGQRDPGSPVRAILVAAFVCRSRPQSRLPAVRRALPLLTHVETPCIVTKKSTEAA